MWNLAAVHSPITRDTQRAHNHTSFARVGRPTQAFHEGVDTVLVEKTNGTIGAAANGRGDVKDIITLAYQGRQHLIASCGRADFSSSGGCPLS